MNLQNLLISAIATSRHLDEPSPAKQHTLTAIAYHIHTQGKTAVNGLVYEAQATHANGGQTRHDGERRTLGGVFFQLARREGWEHASQKQRRRLLRWATEPQEK